MNKAFQDKKARNGSAENARKKRLNKLKASKEFQDMKHEKYMSKLRAKEAADYKRRFDKAVETGDIRHLWS